MTSHLTLRATGLLLVASLAVAACGSSDGGADSTAPDDSQASDEPSDTSSGGGDEPGSVEPQSGGDLTVATGEESEGWFPPTAAWGPDQAWIAYSLFDPLVLIGPEGEFEPYLASSLEPNEDFTTWTVELRPDVVFHDGTALTADVLVENFELLTSDDLEQGEATQAGLLEGVAIEAVDELTVLYTLSTPDAGFPGLLTAAPGTPFSMQSVEEFGTDVASNPVGTGPFKFVSWTPDDQLIVERNTDYWQSELPYLDSITFRNVPEEATRLAGVLSGDLDAIRTDVAGTVGECASSGDLVTHRSDSDNTTLAIVYNVNQPPLDDVRVRRALTHALDQDQLIAVRDGEGVLSPATQPFDEGSVWYDSDVAALYPAHDIEEAEGLVSEYVSDPERSDGKAAGEPIEIRYQVLSDPSTENVNLAVVDMWSQIGIEASYEPFADDTEWLFGVLGTFEGDTPFFGSFATTSFAFEVGVQDPAIQLGAFFGDPVGGIINIADHTSDEIEDALVQLSSTGELAARQTAVAQLTESLAVELPHAYAGNTVAALCASPDVQGIGAWEFPDGQPGNGSPLGVTIWSQAWLADS